MKNKRYIRSTLVILFILLVGFALIPNKTKASIKVIKIAGDNNFPPYEYVDKSGSYKGFNVDIMRAIELEMGVEIEIIPMNWNDAIKALENKEVDAIEGMTYDEKRGEIFSFTEPITINTQNIFVLKDNQFVKSLKELEGKKVSFQLGDISQEKLRDYPNIIKVPRDNQEAAIDALLSNEVTAFVGNRLSGLYYAEQRGEIDKIKIVGDPINSSNYASVTLKENREVFDILNKGIIRIKEDGTYNKIYRKWFGESFIDQRKEARKIIYLMIGVLGIVFMIAIIIMFLNIKLKSMVELRTKELKKNTKALEASEYTFRKLYDDSADAIFLMKYDKIIDCNNSALELLGYQKKQDIINLSPWDISPIVQPDGANSREKGYSILELVEKEKKHKFEWYHAKKNGSLLPVEAMMTSIILNDRNVFHVVLRDISVRKEMENKLEYLSYHDVLTGIYNRRYFEEELKRLDVERNYPLTIVMADVNGLKLINDSFGHSTGDELLKIVAQIIKEGLRSDDILARLGGDEFVVLLPKTSTAETEKVIKRIRNILISKNIGGIDISISFGYETKINKEVQIKDVLNKAEDYMYKKKLFESPSMRSKTVQVIIKTLHEKNKREEKHSHRVSELSRSLGVALNLGENEIEELKTVGLLHDIGKIAIDENILNKPGRLTSDEWEEIKRHPEIGYRILNTSNDMLDIANYVLYHHERPDGRGYPKGLKGEEIPLQSKIIAIADTYDAITSERSYRNALSEETAIAELKKYSGIQFDGKLVKVFIEEVLGKKY